MKALGTLLGRQVGCVRDVDTAARQLRVTIGLFVVTLEVQVNAFGATIQLDRAGVRTLRRLLRQAQRQVTRQVKLAKQAAREARDG